MLRATAPSKASASSRTQQTRLLGQHARPRQHVWGVGCPANPLRPAGTGRRSCPAAASQRPPEPKGSKDSASSSVTGLLSPAEEERLLSFLTYIGITGTLAVGGAALAHISLFSQFKWDLQQLSWAGLCAPILLLDAVMLLPKYHSAAAAPAAGSAKQPGSSKQERDSAALQALRADLEPGAGPLARVRATSTLFQTVAAGLGNDDSTLNKPAKISLELSYVWLRGLTSELLQRGLALTFLAQWLADRAFEAGADDMAFTIGQQPVYTTELASFVAGLVMSLALIPAMAKQAEATSAAVAICAAQVTINEGDEKLDPLIMEWRMMEAMSKQERALPAEAAYEITLYRAGARAAIINTVFALQGNLATTCCMVALMDSLVFAYSELGRSRLPKLQGTGQDKGKPGKPR